MSRKPTSVSRFGIQRKIVANMTSESWRSIPHVSYIFEPDLTSFVEKYKEFDPTFDEDLYNEISLDTCVEKRISAGGTGAASVEKQLEYITEFLAND